MSAPEDQIPNGSVPVAPSHRAVTAGEIDVMLTRITGSFNAAIDRLGQKIEDQDAKFETRFLSMAEQSKLKPSNMLAALAVVTTVIVGSVTGAWALMTRTIETTALVNAKDLERVEALQDLDREYQIRFADDATEERDDLEAQVEALAAEVAALKGPQGPERSAP